MLPPGPQRRSGVPSGLRRTTLLPRFIKAIDPLEPTAMKEFLTATLPRSPNLLSSRPSPACACPAKSMATKAMAKSGRADLLVVMLGNVLASTRNKLRAQKERCMQDYLV